MRVLQTGLIASGPVAFTTTMLVIDGKRSCRMPRQWHLFGLPFSTVSIIATKEATKPIDGLAEAAKKEAATGSLMLT